MESFSHPLDIPVQLAVFFRLPPAITACLEIPAPLFYPVQYIADNVVADNGAEAVGYLGDVIKYLGLTADIK